MYEKYPTTTSFPLFSSQFWNQEGLLYLSTKTAV